MDAPLIEVLSVLADTCADECAREDAWKGLYERTHSYVFRVNSFALGSAAHLAEDATQEVFVRLVTYCTFDMFDGPEAFWAYLRTVCRNVSRSYRHRDRRRSETSLDDIEDIISGSIATVRSWPQLDDHVSSEQICALALGRLDKRSSDREIFELWLGGRTLTEIAREFSARLRSMAVRIVKQRRMEDQVFPYFASRESM